MADFYPAVTTDAGIALVSDMLIGDQIEFTKLVTGSGVYAEEDVARTSLQKATGLREPRQEFGFSAIEKETDNCVLLKSRLTNIELTEGYRMTEIGVYAKKQGEEGDGILYSVSVAREADYFPRYNGVVAVEIIEEYYITVSDAAEVTISGGKGAVVLREDLDKFKEEVYKEVHLKVINLQNQIGNLSQLMTESKANLVEAINEIAEVLRPLVEYSIATNQDIDDILAGIYVDDVDWISTLEIATDRDISLIILGQYEESGEDVEGTATNQDIDDIISGVYVNEIEDNEEMDLTDKEIDRIINNTF